MAATSVRGIPIVGSAATGAMAVERLKAGHACLSGAKFSTGEFRYVEECAEDRLDRDRRRGAAHGGTPAQSWPRCQRVESYACKGRAPRSERRQKRRQAR